MRPPPGHRVDLPEDAGRRTLGELAEARHLGVEPDRRQAGEGLLEGAGLAHARELHGPRDDAVLDLREPFGRAVVGVDAVEDLLRRGLLGAGRQGQEEQDGEAAQRFRTRGMGGSPRSWKWGRDGASWRPDDEYAGVPSIRERARGSYGFSRKGRIRIRDVPPRGRGRRRGRALPEHALVPPDGPRRAGESRMGGARRHVLEAGVRLRARAVGEVRRGRARLHAGLLPPPVRGGPRGARRPRPRPLFGPT